MHKLSGDSFWPDGRMTSGNLRGKKVTRDILSCNTDVYSCPEVRTSPSCSTYNSDDSGIDRTFNLTPSSPLPGESDFEDIQSLDAFQTLSTSQESSLLQNSTKGTRLNECTLFSEEWPIKTSSDQCIDTELTRHTSRETSSSVTKNDNRFHILSYEQILRLNSILVESVPIHSRQAGFPTIWVRLCDLFLAVKENLLSCDIPVRDMRLNGGAASFIIGNESTPNYNDVDVLVSVDLSSNSSTIQRVKFAVLDALMRFLPDAQRNESLWSTSRTSFGSSFGDNPDPSRASHGTVQSVSETRCEPCEKGATWSDSISITTTTRSRLLQPPKSFNTNIEVKIPQETGYISSADDNICCSMSESPSMKAKAESSTPLSDELLQNHFRNGECNIPNSLTFGPKYISPSHSTFSTPSPTTDISLRESYIFKQFRKYSTRETDCWSLISLGIPSTNSKVIEFKFVDRMRRQFEFTVDSFQIHLDSGLSFLQQYSADAITSNFYPTVVAESVAGSFQTALHHLRNKLIQTTEPEMIRGGGLLKYCRLLVSGYEAPQGVDVCTLERYMSSRFFIDFQDIESQKLKMEAFLTNHFTEHEQEQKIVFLKTVYRVVSGSTICLMSYERYQTLNLITRLIEQIAHQLRSHVKLLSLDSFANLQNLTIDKIFLGSQLFPVVSYSKPLSHMCCDHLVLVESCHQECSRLKSDISQGPTSCRETFVDHLGTSLTTRGQPLWIPAVIKSNQMAT